MNDSSEASGGRIWLLLDGCGDDGFLVRSVIQMQSIFANKKRQTFLLMAGWCLKETFF